MYPPHTPWVLKAQPICHSHFRVRCLYFDKLKRVHSRLSGSPRARGRLNCARYLSNPRTNFSMMSAPLATLLFQPLMLLYTVTLTFGHGPYVFRPSYSLTEHPSFRTGTDIANFTARHRLELGLFLFLSLLLIENGGRPLSVQESSRDFLTRFSLISTSLSAYKDQKNDCTLFLCQYDCSSLSPGSITDIPLY